MNDGLPIGMRPHDPDAKVACSSCTACCRRELVVLTAEDDARNYPLAKHYDFQNPFTGAPTMIAIPHKPDGSCVYLGDAGCTIYDTRPKMCRVFSCVTFVERVIAAVPRAERRRDLKTGALDRTIWDAGFSRLAARRHSTAIGDA